MGREVRRVPANWQHPKNSSGHYIPLFGRSYSEALSEWDIFEAQWEQGFCDDHNGGWEPKEALHNAMSFVDWFGRRPDEENYMPDWPEDQRTHWQMYEDTSEGTPISPVMETPEELAHWLEDNQASAFGSMTATYDQWLSTIKRGFACSAVISGGHMDSGVAALAGEDDKL